MICGPKELMKLKLEFNDTDTHFNLFHHRLDWSVRRSCDDGLCWRTEVVWLSLSKIGKNEESSSWSLSASMLRGVVLRRL